MTKTIKNKEEAVLASPINKKSKAKKERKCVPMDGTAGVLILFMAISIGYMFTMIWLLTSDWHYLLGGAPAVAGAVLYLIEKARS